MKDQIIGKKEEKVAKKLKASALKSLDKNPPKKPKVQKALKSSEPLSLSEDDGKFLPLSFGGDKLYQPRSPLRGEPEFTDDLISKLEDYKRKNSENLAKIEKLQGELKIAKSQIAKSNIINFLEQIFSLELGGKVFVDINLSDIDSKESEVFIKGRANVIGSSKKQMRHVIPHAFAKKAIDLIKEGDPQTIIDHISKIILHFIHDKKGYAFKKSLLSDELSETLSNIASNILVTDRDEYYLIEETVSNKKVAFVDTLAEKDKKAAAELFQAKNDKFIRDALKLLQESIYDHNTHIITIEQLCKIILILFNAKQYAAFPEEGNSLNFEIRYFRTKEDACNPSKAKYEYSILSTVEVASLIKKEGLDKQIRIVPNEGARVTLAIDALERINEFLENPNQETYKTYCDLETNGQKPSFSFIKSKKLVYPKNAEEFHKVCAVHIATYSYDAFDFKPLEEYVLVENRHNLKSCGKVVVYPSREGKSVKDYHLIDGDDYRKQAMLEAQKSSDYNKKVAFRSPDDSIMILSKLALQFMTLIKIIFSNFIDISQEISKAFYQLIADQYNFEDKVGFVKKILEEEFESPEKTSDGKKENDPLSIVTSLTNSYLSKSKGLEFFNLLGIENIVPVEKGKEVVGDNSE